MYVCICHGITDRQIREAVDRGAQSLGGVQMQMPVGGCCGRCLPTAHDVVETHLRTQVRASAGEQAA